MNKDQILLAELVLASTEMLESAVGYMRRGLKDGGELVGIVNASIALGMKVEQCRARIAEISPPPEDLAMAKFLAEEEAHAQTERNRN